jgi:hypothetical protein
MLCVLILAKDMLRNVYCFVEERDAAHIYHGKEASCIKQICRNIVKLRVGRDAVLVFVLSFRKNCYVGILWSNHTVLYCSAECGMYCTSQKRERDDAHTVAYSSEERGALGLFAEGWNAVDDYALRREMIVAHTVQPHRKENAIRKVVCLY